MLNISILTIGDEICIGQIINTNASWIASECSKLGASVNIHSSIGDEKDEMISELDRLLPKSDVLIITGGLGPTHDDITKPVLCEYFDDKLVESKEHLERLEEMFRIRFRGLSDRNRAQAMVPSKCKVLKNNFGTAPGMMFEKDGKYIFSLPGVPMEMKFIMQDSILEILKSRIENEKHEIVLYRTIKTFGIPESTLADLLGNPDTFLKGSSLAFLPSSKGIRLRIGASAVSFEEADTKLDRIEKYIRSKAEEFIIGINDEEIQKTLANALIKKEKTIAVAESCTGGMIGANLTDVAGSSAYFIGGMQTYSNEAKINQLGVKRETIEEYGAVSEETAMEMAQQSRIIFSSDIGISATGIAGPGGGTEDKPVGTVYIGYSDKDNNFAERFIISEDRQYNRERTVALALQMVLKEINKQEI